MIKGKLCGEVDFVQDSSQKHFAYQVNHLHSDYEGQWIKFSRYSARALCHKFISQFNPTAQNIRPSAPFGLAKTAGSFRVMYANGNCVTYKSLESFSCYSDQ